MSPQRRPRRRSRRAEKRRAVMSFGARFAMGALLLAAIAAAFFDLNRDGRGALIAVVALLMIGLPLNGLSVRAALKTAEQIETRASRPALYATTALLWLAIAGLGMLALAAPNGWATLDPLFAPFDRDVWIAMAAALVAPAAMAIWGLDARTNRRKRARLRALYREGMRLVAPRTRRELAWFRFASCFSSFGEEVAYRLVLLQALSAWIGAPAAALVSSTAFAFGHLYQGSRAAAVTGFFGLFAAALTVWSGSLWPALALHIAWNQAAAGLLGAVYVRDPGERA